MCLIESDESEYFIPDDFVIENDMIFDLFQIFCSENASETGKILILSLIYHILKVNKVDKEIIILNLPFDFFVNEMKKCSKDLFLCIVGIFIKIQNKEIKINFNGALVEFIINMSNQIEIDKKEMYYGIFDLLFTIMMNETKDFINNYCELILKFVSYIYFGEMKYVYALKCLKILEEFAYHEINIYIIDPKLFTSICSIFEDSRMQEVFKNALCFLASTFYMTTKEISLEIYKLISFSYVIRFFNISIRDKQNIQEFLFLFSNLITDLSGDCPEIIDLIIGEKEFNKSFISLLNGNYSDKKQTIWCLWCMIKCGTIEQCKRILQQEQVLYCLVENIDIDKTIVQNLIIPSLFRLKEIQTLKNDDELKEIINIFLEQIRILFENDSHSDFNEWTVELNITTLLQ